jgi:hypothetical protein
MNTDDKFDALVNSALARIQPRKPRTISKSRTITPYARVFGVWQSIEAFGIGDKVKRTNSAEVYTVTACAYDEYYSAWDVTMIDAAGNKYGELGHNLELVTLAE